MKVLFIEPQIPDYRLPIYNLVGQQVDLTVLHSGKRREEESVTFKQIIIPIKKIGPFTLYFGHFLYGICNNYDVVVSESNIRHIDRNLVILWPFRKFKWIGWGIGVSASYEKEFDSDRRYNFIRYFLCRRTDAQIFYSSYPVEQYVAAGIDRNALFVADNTVNIEYDDTMSIPKKNKILFVGTLYKQKKIYTLLEYYLSYCKNSNSALELHLIGDGDERDNIYKWIADNDMGSYVFMHGAIFNEKELELHFRESYACFSPGQAGLSVLSSMGHGVPYVTSKYAITGGEIFSITTGFNGVLYESHSEIVKILEDIECNPDKYCEYGRNARNFYLSSRTPENMAQQVVNACRYALSA